MPVHALSVFFLLTLVALRAGEMSPAGAPRMELRYQRGDDLRWAAPDWNDRDWPQAKPEELFLPVRDGIYWARLHLSRSGMSVPRPVIRPFIWPADEPDSPIDSIFMAAPFSFELYWDGHLLRRSGVVGADRASERPGPLDNLIPIPEDLLGPGEHVVALRISTAHYNFRTPRAGFYFAMGNFRGRLIYETRAPMLPLVATGCAVLASLFCAVLYGFVDRRRSLLLCSVLSLAFAFFYFLIAWRWLHNDTYDWFAPRLTAIAGTVTLICGLQAWMLLEQFAIPRKRWWLAAFAPFLLVCWMTSPFHAVVVLWLYRAGLVFAIVAAGWAARQKRIGARWALVGALIALASLQASWDSRGFVSPAFLLTFGVQMLFLLIALGLQLREDRRRSQQATLTAARLEIELLKKNIQPHFLMNTLTTIMEVIEQEPKAAVTLIEALAGEFHILADVSGEKLIALGQELELCRAHLRIMSLRRGVECSLETRDVDEGSPVPPALFHTLVEGGVTHQTPRQGRLKFTLEGFYQPGLTRYTLSACGETSPAKTPFKEGTGLRYVKARLEESFAGRWTLTAGPVAEGWQTVIEIKVLPGEELLP